MSRTEESISGVSSVTESSVESGEVTILASSPIVSESTQPTVDETVQKRTKKFTEKGLEWQMEMHSKKFSSLHGVLHTLVTKTESLLTSKDVEALKAHVHALQTNLRVLTETCDRLRGLLILAEQEDKVHQVNIDLESVANHTNNIVIRGERRVREIENEEFETATNYSKRTHSSRRSKLSNSSRSEAAAEAAALRAKLKYIDIEAKTKAELDRLETMRQIEMAEAKICAFDEEKIFSVKEIDDALPKVNPTELVEKYIETCATSQPVGIKIEGGGPAQPTSIPSPLVCVPSNVSPVVETTPVSVHLNPNVQEFIPNLSTVVSQPVTVPTTNSWVHSIDQPKVSVKVENASVPLIDSGHPLQAKDTSTPSGNADQKLLDLAKTLADQVSISRLPPPEPSVFLGDPLKYTGWKSAFQTLIEQRQIPANEKMHYLKKYLGGPVKDVVEHYFLLSSEDAYEEAKKLLEERYGDPFIVANAYRDKLDRWPKINARDGTALQKFADFLRQCYTAAQSIGHLDVLNDDRQNKKMLQKLPDWLVTRWGRIVASHKEEKRKFPEFKVFVDFIVKEAKIACDPVTSLQSLKGDGAQGDSERPRGRFQKNDRSRPVGRSFLTEVQEKSSTNPKPKISCVLCLRQGHELEDCRQFLAKSLDKRKDFVKEKELCFGCFGSGHMSRRCKQRKRCKTCDKMHPTSLHGDLRKSKSDEETSKKVPDEPVTGQNTASVSRSSTTFMNSSGNSNKCSMVVPVYVSHVDDPENEILVYALLDTQSDTTFVLESTSQTLRLSGTRVKLKLSTMYAENRVVESKKIQGLVVRGYNSTKKVSLPQAFTRNIMPANRDHIPTPEMARKWPHLEVLADELMPLSNCEVGLLIGYNCARALAPRDIIPPVEDGPFGQKTDLGWGIVGIVEPSCVDENDSIGLSHRIVACQVPENLVEDGSHSGQLLMSFQTRTKEVISQSDVANMMELDFNDSHCGKTSLSYNDRLFLTTLREGVRMIEGHYIMPLPFSSKRPCLPNNRELALHRLRHLRRKMSKDSQYKRHYFDFMNDIIKKGHAEKVPSSDLKVDDGSVWYIPHHGVYHPKKKDKIRIVFDCSAKFQGTALNDHLLQGPDLTNTLVGVLCRFRKEPVAFMCDIEQMFHQFRVNVEDRNYLRFLWWENENYWSNPIEYRMCVHLFGAASSPGCANFGLKHVADDHEGEFGTSAADFIRRDFYVDDGLKSVPTQAEAIEVIKKTTDMCSKGGLHLHKFTSNSKEVLDQILQEDLAKEIKDLDLLHDKLPIERALGIQWCIESDTFQFRIVLNDRPLTRRGILSTINSVYDPLGFLAPVLLIGKQILQCMCREKADWDTPLSPDLKQRWELWLEDLPSVDKLQIARCMKPKDFGKVVAVQLHHFSDASTAGYGQCSYLRLVDDEQRVHCSLIMGKSRVAPLKYVTIPRLELVAALVSVKVSSLLQRELEYESVTNYFWSDSQIVLGYIANDARRFHTFVANRVQQIREQTEPSQWSYVSTKENPADLASRGTTVKELSHSMWFSGPGFLWKQDLPSNNDGMISELSPDDCELKRVQVFETLAHESCTTSFYNSFKYFSSWARLRRVVALCSRFAQKLKLRITRKSDLSNDKTKPKSTTNSPVLAVEELVQAEQIGRAHV